MQYPISSSLQPYMVGPVFLLKTDDKLSSELLSRLLDITQLVGGRTGVYPNSIQNNLDKPRIRCGGAG